MKCRLLVQAVAILVATAASHAFGSERIDVCARDSSGKAYKVHATQISGHELIQKTNDLTYASYAQYIAIFWDQEHVTLINIGALSPSAIPVDGTDRQGRHWQVSMDSIYCQ